MLANGSSSNLNNCIKNRNIYIKTFLSSVTKERRHRCYTASKQKLENKVLIIHFQDYVITAWNKTQWWKEKDPADKIFDKGILHFVDCNRKQMLHLNSCTANKYWRVVKISASQTFITHDLFKMRRRLWPYITAHDWWEPNTDFILLRVFHLKDFQRAEWRGKTDQHFKNGKWTAYTVVSLVTIKL